MPTRQHALFSRLRALGQGGPVVVAHRGDSAHFAENTLPAFRAADRLGVGMQEFDVRATADGRLICIHDASFDRTTDSATKLGPGALVAATDMARVRELDAGSWHPVAAATAAVPTLAEALEVMLPQSIPLIEHKAGTASAYVSELRRLDALERCILQSFDWPFVAAAARLAPPMASAVLGPTREHTELDDAAVAAAVATGAGMIHWHDRALTTAKVTRAHAAGLLVCSYTTDDELGFRGGAAMRIDAMCTNVPGAMLGWRGN